MADGVVDPYQSVVLKLGVILEVKNYGVVGGACVHAQVVALGPHLVVLQQIKDSDLPPAIDMGPNAPKPEG